ncbi:hypothetical protein [Streptomyces sp. NPDC091215]|uniref:hypothetical protein n=1 Tax=Streptomyces sp. NPDC091215 TaxID=3155192 RepID=UPI0034327423
MASSEESSGRPVVRVSVQGRPGPYRRKVDLTGPGGEEVRLPGVSERGFVRVQVGLGVRAEDLPQLVATARQLRHVAVVEVIGQTRRAVEDARSMFEAAWQILDLQAAPGGAKEAARLWAAMLMAVQSGESAPGGAAFWDGRTFTDPFGRTGGR